jgi:hypothetical protein
MADRPREAASAPRRRTSKKGRRRSVLAVEDPQRSCIVCRATGAATAMLRFGRGSDGSVGFDRAGALPGRGAWVCASARCLHKACEPGQGGFARAFDAAVVLAPGLADEVRAALLDDVLGRLGLLRRQGELVLGRDEVARRAPALALFALADDLSTGSRREVLESLGGRACARLPAMADVGAAVGTRPVGVLGAPAGKATRALEAALARWSGVTAAPAPTSTPAPEDPPP